MTAAEYQEKIKGTLISEGEIQKRIREVGAEITEAYQGKSLVLISVLKGAFVFLADLCRTIDLPCEIEFIRARSYYDGTVSFGEAKLALSLERDIRDCHVIVVEDIIDTGITLQKVIDELEKRHPRSLQIVTLLDKPSRRQNGLTADISLFTIPDKFVVGYGLDCGEYYRNLPCIAEYAG